MINLIIAGLILLFVPILFTLARRALLQRRSDRSARTPSRDAEPAEPVMSPLPARERAGAGIFPAVQDLPRRDTGTERLVAEGKTAPPPPATEIQSAIERVRKLPPLKQAIVWSEILGGPRSLRPPE